MWLQAEERWNVCTSRAWNMTHVVQRGRSESQTPLSLKELPSGLPNPAASGTIHCSVILNILTFTSSPTDLVTRRNCEVS